MPESYTIRPETVDKVLGAGIYNNWQQVQEAFIEEQSRAYENQRRYGYAWAGGLKKQLDADLAFAEKVVGDYLDFLARASVNGYANGSDGEKIIDVLVLAISVLTSVNDLLDDIWGLGIVALMIALSKASLDSDARELDKRIKRLQQALEKARREVKEAYAQLVLDSAISIALLCSGPLGWLALGTIGLGQMIADNYLGPSTSNAATWGSRTNTTLGTATGAAEKYLAATSKVVKVAKPAGKVIPVVGFAFDVNEVLVGYSAVDSVKEAMDDAKELHRKLVDKITLHKNTIARLVAQMNALGQQVQHRSNGWTAQIRWQLEDEMRNTGYRPRI